MKITEPTTAITDYIITGQILFLSIFLLDNGHSSAAQVLWIIGFGFIGIGALLGGTSHGLKENFSTKTNFIIWKATTMSIGLGSFFTVSGTIISSIRNEPIQWILIVLSIVSVILYLMRMRTHHEFVDVVAYYLPMMIAILIFKVISWYIWEDPSSPLIILGVVITLSGSIIQVLKIGLHKHFNHNDLFHVIQMVGIYFFYLGIKELISLV